MTCRRKNYKLQMLSTNGMFTRVKAWSHTVSVARKHVSNWQSLVLKAVSGSDGVFRSRAGGTISCDAKTLLRQLVRLENVWHDYGDDLQVIGFQNTSLVISHISEGIL